MHVLGSDGILAARISALVFQTMAVCIGVVLLWRVSGTSKFGLKALLLVFAALVFNLWASPYYKVFDYGTSILIVAILVLILESSTGRTWFFGGVMLGLSAIMGRNHGVYGILATVLAVLYLLICGQRLAQLMKLSGFFVLGIVVGFSPTLLLAGLIPGFTDAFVASLIDLVQSGATNIPLVVPWPWNVAPGLGILVSTMEILKGLLFVGLLLAPLLTFIVLVKNRRTELPRSQALLAAAAFTGLAYSHYAYSRADITHLALAIFPLLIILLLTGEAIRRPVILAASLLLISTIVLAQKNLFFANKILGKPLDAIEITGSKVYVAPYFNKLTKEMKDALRSDLLNGSESSPNADFLAIPNFPTLYAMEKKKMPIWEIYALWPRKPDFEKTEIARLNIAKPGVVILSNHALDGREDMRYSLTHPLMYAWINENYQKVATEHLAKAELDVYVRKNAN